MRKLILFVVCCVIGCMNISALENSSEEKEVTNYNEIKKYSIVINKKLEVFSGIYWPDIGIGGVYNFEPGNNIKYGLYALENILDEEGTIKYEKDSLITEINIQNGIGSYKNIPYGSYYLKEISCPNNYVLDETITELSLIDEVYEREFYFEGKLKKGNLTIRKINKNIGLPNAVFELYGDKYLTTIRVTSDELGYIILKEIPYDLYHLKEIAAPTGYIIDDEEKNILLETETHYYEFENEKEQDDIIEEEPTESEGNKEPDEDKTPETPSEPENPIVPEIPDEPVVPENPNKEPAPDQESPIVPDEPNKEPSIDQETPKDENEKPKDETPLPPETDSSEEVIEPDIPDKPEEDSTVEPELPKDEDDKSESDGNDEFEEDDKTPEIPSEPITPDIPKEPLKPEKEPSIEPELPKDEGESSIPEIDDSEEEKGTVTTPITPEIPDIPVEDEKQDASESSPDRDEEYDGVIEDTNFPKQEENVEIKVENPNTHVKGHNNDILYIILCICIILKIKKHKFAIN